MINKLLKFSYVIVAVSLLFAQFTSAMPTDDDLNVLSRFEYLFLAPLEPYLSSDGKTLYNAALPVVYVADTNPSREPLRIPAPFDLLTLPPESATSTFSITYVPNGGTDPWGESCTTFPVEAKPAFDAAASVWANIIQSPVPITISACWANLGSSSVLGYSGGGPLQRDFTGAPRALTWYAGSLANAMARSDLDPSSFDMHITYNLNFSWYYGTDGNTPAGQYDLMSVVLHEIAHGLNFSGSMRYSGGNGSWGYSTGYPNIYDNFMRDGSGNQLINTGVYPNPSTALGSALTSNNIWFHGSNAMAANGGLRVKMYAPSTWAGGSSYSHLDYATFNNTLNELMVYAFSDGESIHDPGPVTEGLLEDLGWQIGPDDESPTIDIMSPTTGNTYSTNQPTIDISGTASDNVGVVLVTWTNDRGGSGNASGTTSWFVNGITLYIGENIITVTARDAAGWTSDDILVVTYNPPALQFSSATYSVNENGGTAVITVTRTGGSSGAVGVSYATNNGTATAGSDYTSTSGTLSWSDGDTSNKTFSVPITNDTLDESNETFMVTLSSPMGGATLGSPASATVTITDNDPTPTVQFSAASSSGSEATTPALITVTLSTASGQTVTVNYVTANGTATAGSDYTVTSGMLTFNPGVTSQTISVPIINDTAVEGNETFTVTLSGPVNATVGAIATHTYTINDDDNAGTIQLSSATYSVNENGGSVLITVTRTGGSSGAVGVSYATNNGTATAGSDYTSTSGALSWSNGDTSNKTFSISILDDSAYEGDETVNLTLSSPTGGAILGSPSTAVLTIIDNDADTMGPSLSITSHSDGRHVNTPSITLAGTASDAGRGDNGIQQVTVNGIRANNDTATGSGTANWNTEISLNPGANSITVVAYDNSSNHNTTTLSITIYYVGIVDFDGDGKTDIAVYHDATGFWFIKKSSDGTDYYVGYGGTGYDPVPGDYDGDGKSDIAVYHSPSGLWFIKPSSGGADYYVGYGGSDYKPVPADYDGDGKTDIAVYHSATGLWFIKPSSGVADYYVGYGGIGYAPVPGDYDGDGKTDIAVYHSATGLWFIKPSSGVADYYVGYGGTGYDPVPGDYDGDGNVDVAVYHQATGLWFIKPSSGVADYYVGYGGAGYVPINLDYLLGWVY